MITRVKYKSIQKHGSYYVNTDLKDIDITCPECSYCESVAHFKTRSSMRVQSNIHNVFTLECWCGCVFVIEVEKEN